MLDLFKYTLLDWRLQKGVKRRYYSDLQFLRVDRFLLKCYVFKNPYKISKRYLKSKKESDIHTYGETPLRTYEVIANEVGIDRSDSFLELGCGRGRGVFFIHHFFQCKVIGVEWIPLFVQLAEHCIRKNKLKNISFRCGNMTRMLPHASIVYLYGTCLKDEEIDSIIEELKTFPKMTKVITISYPLTDYDKYSFYVEKSFSVSFPWGETEAYLQIVR